MHYPAGAPTPGRMTQAGTPSLTFGPQAQVCTSWVTILGAFTTANTRDQYNLNTPMDIRTVLLKRGRPGEFQGATKRLPVSRCAVARALRLTCIDLVSNVLVNVSAAFEGLANDAFMNTVLRTVLFQARKANATLALPAFHLPLLCAICHAVLIRRLRDLLKTDCDVSLN